MRTRGARGAAAAWLGKRWRECLFPRAAGGELFGARVHSAKHAVRRNPAPHPQNKSTGGAQPLQGHVGLYPAGAGERGRGRAVPLVPVSSLAGRSRVAHPAPSRAAPNAPLPCDCVTALALHPIACASARFALLAARACTHRTNPLLARAPRTTIVMNIPYTAVHFSVYESAKKFLLDADRAPPSADEALHATGLAGAEGEEPEEGLAVQVVAGGLAGGAAAAITTPLDVVKTRLQTEGVASSRRYGTTAVVSVCLPACASSTACTARMGVARWQATRGRPAPAALTRLLQLTGAPGARRPPSTHLTSPPNPTPPTQQSFAPGSCPSCAASYARRAAPRCGAACGRACCSTRPPPRSAGARTSP